jgi:hypothetical protein
MHRLLQRAGVCSLSEPCWFDELCFRHGDFAACSDEEIRTLIKIGHLVAWTLATNSFPDATLFAMNPKSFVNCLGA